MREIAQRLRLTRRTAAGRAAGATVAVLATLTTVAALGAPAAMAASGVTIKTGFETSPISLSQSDAIGYGLTNSTTTPQTVTFTDTLPGGVSLDNPLGTTNTNGTGTCTNLNVTGTPGATSVTVIVTVPNESASGTVCTISFAVVASTPSANDVAIKDAYSDVSASTVTPTTTTGSLVVLSNPTLTLTAPSNNQSFALGQVFDTNFACTKTDPLDAVDTFFGTDDEGNQIQSGAPLDTVDPGTRSLQINCYSAVGGGDVSQTINYRVGSYTLSSVKRTADQVSFRTLVPAGKLVAKVIYGRKVVGTASVTVSSRRTVRVTVKPSAAGTKLLAATKGRSAKVTLQVSLLPSPIGSGDSQISPAAATVVTRSLKLPVARAAANRR